MSRWTVPLADVVVDEQDLRAVVDTYRSGWLSMGPRTAEFEEAFAGFTGARHAVAVTNGTAALHLACLAAGLGPGDEVLVPSMTFVATVNAIRYCGATPVFVDIAGLTTPWMSADGATAAITPRTRAILTVDYGGHCGELRELTELARTHGLALLEDAAHAAGSRLDGRHLGTFGRAGAFSFFSNKNLAVGEGGAVVTDDDSLATHLRLLRSHGMTSLTWDRHRGHASSYDVVDLGFNYRMDEPRAALAMRRLLRLDEENTARRSLDQRYRAALEPVGVTCALPCETGLESAHHLFAVVLDDDVDRDALRARMTERGVQTSVHYPPVHRFSAYAGQSTVLPLTEAYGARALTLPLFAHMTEAQQDRVVEALTDALDASSSGRLPHPVAPRT